MADEAEEAGDPDVDVTAAAIGGSNLSAPGTFVLIWGLSALALAAIDAADGVGAVEALAALAGVVGLGAAAADFVAGRRPGTTTFLFVGVPALLGAGLAAIAETWLTAVGLAAVGVATLGRVTGLPFEPDVPGGGGDGEGGDED